MTIVKQSTAITVKLGPFLDDATGKDVEAALTLQKADVRLSKNGGDMAAATADQGAADAGAPYDELGYYDISLDATDTNTCGRLKVMVHETGALPVWAEYQVVEEAVYDALYAADATGYNVGKTGYTLTATTGLGNQTANITGDLSGSVGSVTGAVGSVTGAVASVTGAVGSVTGAVASVTGAVGSVTGAVGSVAAGGITATSFADNAITAAKIADAAIDNATFAADVGSTAYATNIIALAVRKVLDTLNLDHLMLTPVANSADMTVEVADGTVLSNLMSSTSDTSTFAVATDSLEGLASHASHGLDKLVRSTTPANTLDVNATGEAGADIVLVNGAAASLGEAQTGDAYAEVTNATYGLAKLVRSTTPANTLDVSATGEAGIDWANVGSPTTTVGLTGTTVGTVTANTDMRGTDSAALASAWTAARAGYQDKLNVSGTLAHSDAAATYKAAGFSTHDAAAVVTALGTGSTLTAITAHTDNIPDVAVSGAVVLDGSNDRFTFKTDLSSSQDDFYNDRLCVVTSGTMVGFCAVVTDYNGTSKFLTLEAGLPDTVPSESTFMLVPNGQNPVAMRTAVGLASADLDTQLTVLGYLPAVTAGAAGGLFIAGANAATTLASLTCTGALTVSDGVIVTASTTNRDGISVTGNGTGDGMALNSGSGATGDGLRISANSTDGDGMGLYAIGTGWPMRGSIVGNITGNLSGSVGSVAGAVGSVGTGGITDVSLATGAITAAKIASNAITDAKIATGALTAAKFAAAALDDKGNWNVGKTGYTLTVTTGLGNQTATITGNLTGNVTGNVGGNVTGSVGSVAAGGIAAASIAASALNGKGDWNTVTPPTAAENRIEMDTNSTELTALMTRADRVDALIEDAAGDRWTAKSLEQAPTGGGTGTADWTADEKTAFRAILGIPISGSTPETPAAGALFALKAVADTVNTNLTRSCCLVIGNISTAQAVPEVFTYGGVTGTVTGDADGNRTVVFT